MSEYERLFDLMKRRRSVRRFEENRPVGRETIRLLLEAAMTAPSACNLMPWEFIVVDDPQTLSRLKACVGENNGRHYNAPAALVACANTGYIPWDGDGAMDVAAAIQSILLAVTALGLGAVWIGDFNYQAVKSLMDIPDHVAISSIVYIGYPAQEREPRCQYNEEAVYWQKYDPERPHPKRDISLRLL